MNLLTIVVCFSFIFLNLRGSYAAKRVPVEKRLSEMLHHYRTKRDINESPSSEQLLGLQQGEHLEPVEEVITATGNHKIKLQETYNGVPIIEECVVIEMDENGEFTGEISGQVLEGVEEDIHDTTPDITEDEALEIACNFRFDDPNLVAVNDIQLRIYEEDEGLEEVHPRLVYDLSYITANNGQTSRPHFIIDAKTGEVLKTWEALTMGKREGSSYRITKVKGVGGNEAIGKYWYGPKQKYPSLKVYTDGEMCYMENEHIRVVDMQNADEFMMIMSMTEEEKRRRPLDNRTLEFGCREPINDTQNGAYSPINDAYYFSNVVYDMYTKWYDVEPLETTIVTRVHYGNSLENAFWDGRHINFGDGGKLLYPMVVLDHVAHEMSHGFTEGHSDLLYAGHSGAINEAFSDMAGVTAETYLNETDWMMGVGAVKNLNISSIYRFIQTPSRDGISIDHYDDYCPGIDVHLASGIFNKAFYLLSDKPDWGIKATFKVFLLANTLYWTRSSSFFDAACGVRRAAGDEGRSTSDVDDVFRQVGIEPCGTTTKGMDSLHDLSAETGGKNEFVFDVDETVTSLRFETLEFQIFKGDADIEVDTNVYQKVSASAGTSKEVVNITGPAAVPHTVSVVASKAYNKVDLYAIISEETVAESATLDEKGSFNFSLQFPQDVIANGRSIAVRAEFSLYKMIQPKIFAKYGEPVDLKSMRFDHMSEAKHLSGTRPADSETISQIILCNVKEGEYHFTVTLSALPGAEISVWYVTLLKPKL